MNKNVESLEKLLTKVILTKLQKEGIISIKQQEKIIEKY